MMIYHQIEFGCKILIGLELIKKCMHMAYNDVSPYWVWLQKVQRLISSKLTLTEMFNLGCDIDLEHSNSIFSLDIAYDALPSD